MKKQLLTLFAASCTGFAFCQAIPNGGFENWVNTNYEDPQFWGTSNYGNINNNVTAPNNAVKTNDAFNGSFAIQLNTVLNGTDTAVAYVADGNPGASQTGGIPYSQLATGISFRYKSTIMPGDSALIILQFKKSGSTIGNYIYKIGATQSSYTLFSMPFVPALPMAPDTLVFAAASSNAFVFAGIPGNMLQLDSVTFTGVSQPVNFNGDFETWNPLTHYDLTGWELNGSGPGVMQTTDAHSGTYALELKTYNDPNNGGQTNMGTATTGKQGQFTTIGGYPYTQQFDSLIFWYKYTPADPNDSANVWAQTKLNGTSIGGAGMLLGSSAVYKRAAMVMNSSSTPDSLIVNVNSYKTWPVPISSIGADLKIDDMYTLSSPLGIKMSEGDKSISIFPNPSNGIFNLGIRNSPFVFIQKVTIYDIQGNIIENRSFGSGTMKTSENFDLSRFGSGVYLVQVTTNAGMFSKKFSKTN